MAAPRATGSSEAPDRNPPRLESLFVLSAAWVAVLIASSLVLFWAAPAGSVGPAAAQARPKLGPGLVIAGTLANELAVALVLVIYVKVRRAQRALLVPLKAPTLRGLLGTLLVVAGAVPWADFAGILVQRWTGRQSEVMQTVLLAVQSSTGWGLVGLLVALALVPAVVEETLFRGVVTACFSRSRWEAVIVPSVMFGVFHLELQQAAATTVLGFAFALGRLYTRSLLPTVIAHGLYNGGVIMLMRQVGPATEPRFAWQLALGGALVFAAGIRLLGGVKQG